MAKPCYGGPNPVRDDERLTIWKWAKEQGGANEGFPIHSVANAVNTKFFGGMAKPEWIDDILSGKKTPFREVALDMWKKQYNSRLIVQQAKDLSRIENMGPVAKKLRQLWTLPRSLAVFGHGVVFPITHGGDLIFRPESWGTFIKGTLRTYRGAFNLERAGLKDTGQAYTGRVLDSIQGDSQYDLGIRSGVDMGPKSRPSGLITRTYHGPAQRAWDLLTVMRFDLWKQQMSKFVEPGMSNAEVLEIGQKMADWANKATGSSVGPISRIGGEGVFGPKLTQAKLSKIFADPVTTAKTFANWDKATPGEKAVAWTRLSGATQFLAANLGFLAVNQGLLSALGQKDKINVTDPMKSDFLAFKGGGVLGNVPGLHTEIRTLGKILATAFMSRKELRGDTKFTTTAKIAGQYGLGKLHPSFQRILELGLGENWLGRPVPWSTDPGTKNKPRMTYGEFAASIGPIPLEGPTGYVYDTLKKKGVNSVDAAAITKALIIGGLGAPGFHVREDYTQK